jgi:hypothetical protein
VKGQHQKGFLEIGALHTPQHREQVPESDVGLKEQRKRSKKKYSEDANFFYK